MFAPFAPFHHAFGVRSPDHHRGGGRQPWMSSGPFGYAQGFAPPSRGARRFDSRYMRPMEGDVPFERPSHRHCPPLDFSWGSRPFVDGPPPPHSMAPHCGLGYEASPRCCRPLSRTRICEDDHEPMSHGHSRRHPRHHPRRHHGMPGPPPTPPCSHRDPPSPTLPPHHGPPPSPSHRGAPPPRPSRQAPCSHEPLYNEGNLNERQPLHEGDRRHRPTHDGQHQHQHHHHHRHCCQQQDGHSRRGRGGHRRRHRGHHHHPRRHAPTRQRDDYTHCEWCPPPVLPTHRRRSTCDCAASEMRTLSDESGEDSETDESSASEDEQEPFEVVQPHQESQHCEDTAAEE